MAHYPFPLRKHLVQSRQGMVATAHPLASQAGLRILQEGGNVVDATVATAAVLNVIDMDECGLGGDAFLIVHLAGPDETWALNGGGAAPTGATRDYFTRRGITMMPLEGILSVSVPGVVDAYVTALERWGSMPLAELLQPAISYAEEGFPLSEPVALSIDRSKKLDRFPTTRRVFRDPSNPARPGGIFRQRDLAGSLRLIAEGGREAFYEGPIAGAIVRQSAEEGDGLFTLEDLKAHRSEVYRPLQMDYRGFTVYETAPPSQGLIVLEALALVEAFDLASMGFGSAETIHTMVEAKKLAFADRNAYAGDPRFVDAPVSRLLSSAYAAERRRAIDPDRADNAPTAGTLADGDNTSSFVVADGEGNAVSFIQSVSAGYGSGVIAGETGIFLNNRAGRAFTLEEGHPNCIAPGKRPMYTLNCYMVFRDGRPTIVGGTPGGDRQPQHNFQVIASLLDFGFDAQEAVEAPRWSSLPGSDPATLGDPLTLMIERRFPEETVRELAAKGHRMDVVGDWGAGGEALIIVIDPDTGVLSSGCDPRCIGCAIGY